MIFRSLPPRRSPKAAAPAPAGPPAPQSDDAEAEFDDEDRLLIKAPLSPGARPAPTYAKPEPAAAKKPPVNPDSLTRANVALPVRPSPRSDTARSAPMPAVPAKVPPRAHRYFGAGPPGYYTNAEGKIVPLSVDEIPY
ncbi:hypothetical protein [Bradyrhizobium sp.]|uniref:hypothetical protein n=1 Tax=Bradyrhizobium sp. TaxID=376 RepID=UPI0007C91B20|nr:hypothetical protein [Bradyrhizobium sp.]